MVRLIVITLLVGLLAAGGAPQASNAPNIEATIEAGVRATLEARQAAAPPEEPGEEPTDPPEPTNTPEPTSTPEPTPTPQPTNTPEPTATPMPPTPVPEPVVLEGVGPTATDPIRIPSSLNRVITTHAGERNIIVYGFGPNDNETLLANGIGNYTGSKLLTGDAGDEYVLEVQADGSWTIRIEPITLTSDQLSTIEGTGDYVSDLFEPAQTGVVPYNFSHMGERNFISYLHCASGTELVANDIGTVEGSSVARIQRGPCLWEIQADGSWRLQPR